MIRTVYPSDSAQDGFGTFMRSVGRHKLLTPEEEIRLGRQVQEGIRIDALLYGDRRKLEILESTWIPTHRKKYKVPPTQEELTAYADQARQELISKLQADYPGATQEEMDAHQRRLSRLGQRAFERMIECNLRLVVSLAKKYSKMGLEINDLIQEGALGLARGVEKFDPSLGYKLCTYCYWWIRQAINRALSNQSRAIRLPVHVTELLSKMKKYINEFRNTHGRNPTDREIASHFVNTSTNMFSLDDWIQTLSAYRHIAAMPYSLDHRIGENEDTTIIDLVTVPEDLTQAQADEMRDAIDLVIGDQLDPRQRDIFERRYGLLDGRPQSPAQIAEETGLTRGQIKSALRRARELLMRESSDLRSFLGED